MGGFALASPDAEEALLSAMLSNHTAVLSTLQQGLRREDFGYDVNGTIFASICRVVDEGKQVDPITVQAEIEASGKLELIGGKHTLMRIVDLVGDPNRASEYTQIVKDRSLRRSMRAACEKIMHDLHNDSDIKRVINTAEDQVYRVGELMQGTGTSGLSGSEMMQMWRSRSVDRALIPYFYRSLNKVNHGRRPGFLTIWAGYTSDGKSIAAIQEAMNACGFGHRVALYSLEMTDDEIMCRLLSQLTGIEPSRIELNDTDYEEGLVIDRAVEHVGRWDLHVYADPAYTPADIRARQMRERSDLVIIDYLQRFDFTEWSQIPRIAKQFKNLALSTRSCVDLLSQLTPPQERGPSANPFPMPNENMLYGGKATGHEANAVLFVWSSRERDEETGVWQRAGVGEMVVGKFRGGKSGFSVPIYFDENHVGWFERKREPRQLKEQTELPLNG